MPLSIRAPLPDFGEGAVWINGRTSREALRGRPVLVHFWSVGCRLCLEEMPLLDFLRDTVGAPAGLALVGIHVPRTAPDRDPERIAEAVRTLGIDHPVLADDGAMAAAFRNEHVPTYYLFDESHRLRHAQAGEHALRAMERRLAIMAGRRQTMDAGRGPTEVETMTVPGELLYSEDHVWVRRDGRRAVIGVTAFAGRELGDIVFVELPEPGGVLTAGEPFGSMESVKTVSELYAPVSGTVTAVNEALLSAPEAINRSPYGEGWLLELELKDPAELDRLWTADRYRQTYEDDPQ